MVRPQLRGNNTPVNSADWSLYLVTVHCCLLSITERSHHTNDSVSSVVVRQPGKHDGWVKLSDAVQLAEAGDQSLSKWTKLAPATPA